MSLDNGLLNRLVMAQLPGLAAALQSAGGSAVNSGQLQRRQSNQDIADTMLRAAAGMLSPSPNRYPLGRLQRLGLGLGAALGGYDGDLQGGQLAGLITRGTMPNHARASTPRIHGRSAGPDRLGEGLVPSLPLARREAGSNQPRTARKGKQAGMLREFRGELGRRLESPAVLPGGWTLHGYAKEGAKPVYIGPAGQLMIYG